MTEELSRPASYGLIEGVGQGRTDIDGDADAEFFEICAEIYGGEYVKTYY
jgi:hypothetical protein